MSLIWSRMSFVLDLVALAVLFALAAGTHALIRVVARL